jgi:HPt (histidine-containing phosphotransfer) domain-containing protein
MKPAARFAKLCTQLKEITLLEAANFCDESVDRIIAGSDLSQLDSLVASLVKEVPHLRQSLQEVHQAMLTEQSQAAPDEESRLLLQQEVQRLRDAVLTMHSSLANLGTPPTAGDVDAALAQLAAIGEMMASVVVAASVAGASMAGNFRKEMAEHALQLLEEVCSY